MPNTVFLNLYRWFGILQKRYSLNRKNLNPKNRLKGKNLLIMILEEDSLLNFNYDTNTHILSVRYPDLSGIPFSQIQNSLQKLYRNVVNYDVKKLLLDLRKGLRGLTETQYRELTNDFLKQLSQTRLEKIARILPDNPAREYLVEHYAQVLRQDIIVNFVDQSFSNRAEALAWLIDDESPLP